MSNEPSPQALRYIKPISYRLNELPEEEIANKLGFDSPTELYRQVSQDDYPICPVCATTDVPRIHCSPEREYKRRAGGGTSEAEKLPPADAAAPLFHQALKNLAEPSTSIASSRTGPTPWSITKLQRSLPASMGSSSLPTLCYVENTACRSIGGLPCGSRRNQNAPGPDSECPGARREHYQGQRGQTIARIQHQR
jgi:hypothetical protein